MSHWALWVRAAKRGGFKRGGFPIWTCPSFLSFFVPFGTFLIFPGFSGFARGWSRDFPDSSLFSFSAYEEHLRGTVRDTTWPFPEKSGKPPGLKIPGLASLKLLPAPKLLPRPSWNPCFFRFPRLFRFALFLGFFFCALLLSFPRFESKGFAERKSLVFSGDSRFLLPKKQGLEGQGTELILKRAGPVILGDACEQFKSRYV